MRPKVTPPARANQIFPDGAGRPVATSRYGTAILESSNPPTKPMIASITRKIILNIFRYLLSRKYVSLIITYIFTPVQDLLCTFSVEKYGKLC
jgi:hypothetical protein